MSRFSRGKVATGMAIAFALLFGAWGAWRLCREPQKAACTTTDTQGTGEAPREAEHGTKANNMPLTTTMSTKPGEQRMVGDIPFSDLLAYKRTVFAKVPGMTESDHRAYLLSEIKGHRDDKMLLAITAAGALMKESEEAVWQPVMFDLLRQFVASADGMAARDECVGPISFRPTTYVEAFAAEAVRLSPNTITQATAMMASSDYHDRAAGSWVIRSSLMMVVLSDKHAHGAKREDTWHKAVVAFTEHLVGGKIPSDCGRWITCGGNTERIKAWLGVVDDRPEEDRRRIVEWLISGGCLSTDVAANRETLAVLKGTGMESSIEDFAERGADAARRLAVKPDGVAVEGN